MPAKAKSDDGDTRREFRELVNMTPARLESWLACKESKNVGDSHAPGGDGGESTGHRSGRKIIAIKRTKAADLTAAQIAHMRKVIGYIRRHLAQRPNGDVRDTKWRYSLMNWGHDPLKS